MAEIYSKNHTIACYEADANQLMRPTAMLDMMQEAANINATALGFGYDELINSNTAWVLSRIHVKFEKLPLWRQEVNLKTWHKGVAKLFYLRDFILSDTEGNTMIKATTSWLIIDMNTRRLVRNSDLATSPDKCNKEDAIAEPADKVVVPVDIEPELVRKHPVTWSEIDTNGHVNNVKYAVWALDAVKPEDIKERPLKELLINYDAEVMPGDTVKIYRTIQESEDGLVYYITGKVDDKQNFSVKLIF
ncbi:MAG: thioesterase [Bacteroidales bacterium]|nr:thioesterase [Bacteroidales bacterium]